MLSFLLRSMHIWEVWNCGKSEEEYGEDSGKGNGPGDEAEIRDFTHVRAWNDFPSLMAVRIDLRLGLLSCGHMLHGQRCHNCLKSVV